MRMMGKTKTAAILCFIICAALMFAGCATEVKNSVEDAKSYWWEEGADFTDIYGIELLPRRSSNASITDFYFSLRRTLLTDDVQLFIDCVYGTEDYYREVERLKNLEIIPCFSEGADPIPAETSYYSDGALIEEYPNGTRFFDDETFVFPAYVQALQWGTGWEYALLDEAEHRIIYVYMQYVHPDEIEFDKTYLPQGRES